MSYKPLGPSIAVAALLLVGGSAFAATGNNGPEPYTAPTPSYTPMKAEPKIKAQPAERLSLGSDADIKGPAAGPEPYSAPTPVYQPMTKEPLLPPPAKTPAPKL